MGKAIVYCGDCGRSLSEEDFARGKAHTLEAGPYCTACRPLPAAAPAAPIPRKISTTRIPAVSPGTRRAAAPASPRGQPRMILVGAAAAGAAVLGILLVILIAGGKGSRGPAPPEPVTPRSPSPSPAPPPPPDKAGLERRARSEREEAERLEAFLAQIREMIKDGARLPERRTEVEGMIASAEKGAGPRLGQVQALRAELAKALEEAARERERQAQLEEILPRIREAIKDVRTLRQRRADVENLLDQAEKLAGPRRGEVDALRAECVSAFNRAEKRRELVGHWRLDGDARDSSGSGFHGNAVGNPAAVPGQLGQALQFNGADQVVNLPNSPELDRVHEDSYTLSAWFRPDAVPPTSEEDSSRSRSGILLKQGWHLGLTYDHRKYFIMDHWISPEKNVGVVGDSKACLPGAWYHVAGVVDREAGATLVYVNGQRVKKRTWPPGSIARNYGKSPWRIGQGAPGSPRHAWPARGAIDDVRIYDRALEAAEILKLHEAGLAGRDP